MITAQYPLLSKFKEEISHLYQARLDKLYLFGSRARKTNESESDFDILVVLKGEVDPNEERYRTLETVTNLSLEYDTVISCIYMDSDSYNHKQGQLLRNIHREGILI